MNASQDAALRQAAQSISSSELLPMALIALPDVEATITCKYGPLFRSRLDHIFPELWPHGQVVYVPESSDSETGEIIPPRMYKISFERIPLKTRPIEG